MQLHTRLSANNQYIHTYRKPALSRLLLFGTICVVYLQHLTENKMKKGKILATAAMAALIAISPLAGGAKAQSKAETKLYKTVMTKRDLKNANKFLSKFPESQYKSTVQKIKDSIVFYSLNSNDVKGYISFVASNPKSFYTGAANTRIQELNTSSISPEQALEGAVAAGFPKEEIAFAAGVKNMNQEHIAVILAPKAGTTAYTIALLVQNNGNWESAGKVEEQVYTNDYALKDFTLGKDAKAVTINGMQYLYYSYANSTTDVDPRSRIHNNDSELVLNLYSLEDNTVYNILFSGKTQDGILYGSSMDAEQAGAGATEQQAFLISQMNGMENLKPYEEERFQAQELIKWWYNNNPQGSKDLAFGIIPDNSPLIPMFSQCKDKEKIGNYTVALLENIFGNTIIMVLNNQSKQYSLAMCQPTPQSDKDLELNTFYGEKNGILSLYYFKGKTSVKKRLNLISKRLY